MSKKEKNYYKDLILQNKILKHYGDICFISFGLLVWLLYGKMKDNYSLDILIDITFLMSILSSIFARNVSKRQFIVSIVLLLCSGVASIFEVSRLLYLTSALAFVSFTSGVVNSFVSDEDHSDIEQL